MKENPRYNVVSTRLCDVTYDAMKSSQNYTNAADFLNEAIKEKIERDSNGRKNR